MSLRPEAGPTASLADTQATFARHLRDPEIHPAPAGLSDRRLNIYRDLFFGNVEGLLAANFPVLKSLLGRPAWEVLARDFFREHRAQTPLFTEIGREFLRYLEARPERRTHLESQENEVGLAAGIPADPPWLMELAHYEWVELALSIDERELAEARVDEGADFLTDTPVVSPLAWPLAYRFPVHRLAPDFKPTEVPNSPTLLLVLRDRRDEVRFSAIDPLTYALLQRLHAGFNGTGTALLEELADAAGGSRQNFVGKAPSLYASLADRDALLGARFARA